MNKKTIISFDTNCWQYQHFQNFIKSMVNDDKFNSEFYIITQDINISFVKSVGEQAKINSDHIIQVEDQVNKLEKIQENQVNFHFDSDLIPVNYINSFNTTVDIKLPFSFFVNWLTNTYTLEMKYIQQFEVQLDRYFNEYN